METDKLIIAAAGSGKTTFLVKEALKTHSGKLLITTFTQANETEIRKKFIELNGCIPENVTVQTWFSFLLQHGVRPYQSGLYDVTVRGIVLVNELSGVKYVTSCGKKIYYSETKDLERYYFTGDSRIYSDKISKFVCLANEKSNGAVLDRLSRIFTGIFIDEIQDLAGYDLEIVKLLLKSRSRILMVGDPRQVTYHTHNEKKYAKYKEGKIKQFIQYECRNTVCEIDEVTLGKSYRNNDIVCQYSSRLFPGFEVCGSNQDDSIEHKGIFLVKPEDVEYYLRTFNPMQLRDSVRVQVNKNFPCLNFGESKGLTFDRVLIYPTSSFIKWIEDNNHFLPPKSRSKLYVALTRAKFSVGIIYNPREGIELRGLEKFVVP